MTPCLPDPGTICVTGGSGFIGQAVYQTAQQAGYNTLPSFDRSNGHEILGDLTGLAGADVVIHLAGMLGTHELFGQVEQAIDVNIKGTYRILEWCRTNNARYVGISMPPVFESVYTATKVCASRLATAWHLFRGVPVSHVQAFNAYGPGQAHGPGHPQKIVPTFATEAWAGRPLPIFGDGTQTMDLIHVDDLGRMLVDAARFGDDEVFDGGTGQPVTVNDLAEFVLAITGSKAGVQHLPMRDGEIPQEIVAQGRGWDLLDWKPGLDMEKLAQAVISYRPVR